MAPTLSMSVTGVQVVRLLGRAAPLAYALAGAVVLLIGYGFVRLSAAFSHAGSVYAFIGKTLGPGAGLVATWMLLGTYIVFPPVSVLGMAVFTQAFLRHTGIAASADWLPIALISWILVWVLVSRGIRLTARSVITVEAISLVLIAALIVVIYVRLGTGDAPGRQTLTADVFKLPPSTGLAAIGLAGTFGILSFGGFESSISAGEESRRPTEAIPRSVVAAVLFGAVFYVFCVSGQVLGFGAGVAGVARFAHSTAPLGDLAEMYVGPAMAAVLDVAAVLSALGAALVGVAVASRTLYALARDRIVWSALATVSDQTGTPDGAVTASMTVTFALLLAFGLTGTSALNAFFYLATIGGLSLLVVYVLVSISALRVHTPVRDRRSLPSAILPVGGAVAALYVLYRNLVPAPAFPFSLFPYLVAGWLVTGLMVAAAMPRLRQRVSEGLALH
jgi:amino acid transporter